MRQTAKALLFSPTAAGQLPPKLSEIEQCVRRSRAVEGYAAPHWARLIHRFLSEHAQAGSPGKPGKVHLWRFLGRMKTEHEAPAWQVRQAEEAITWWFREHLRVPGWR